MVDLFSGGALMNFPFRTYFISIDFREKSIRSGTFTGIVLVSKPRWAHLKTRCNVYSSLSTSSHDNLQLKMLRIYGTSNFWRKKAVKSRSEGLGSKFFGSWEFSTKTFISSKISVGDPLIKILLPFLAQNLRFHIFWESWVANYRVKLDFK